MKSNIDQVNKVIAKKVLEVFDWLGENDYLSDSKKILYKEFLKHKNINKN